MSHVQLALVGLSIGDELFEIVDRQILAHGEQLRLFGDQADRLEILLRVVAEIGIEKWRSGVCAHVAGNESIAVGGRACRTQRPKSAAGPADVFDDELLVEMSREYVRHDAARNVRRSTCGEWHNHGYGPRRIVLCGCVAQAEQQ